MSKSVVYFAQREDGLIKIGLSRSYKRRLADLSKSHGSLTLIRLVNGAREREAKLHYQFRRAHEYGEWFRPEPGVLEEIAALEEGDPLEAQVGDLRVRWKQGEASMADEACRMTNRMIELRSVRESTNTSGAMTRLCEDYELPMWFLSHIRSGRCRSVGAFALQRLRDAIISELEKSRDDLREIIAHEKANPECVPLRAALDGRKGR